MTEAVPDSIANPPPGDWRKKELRLAVANAAKLGTSLIATWGIGLVARLYIPRYLGPDRFGMLNFAEAFSATAFVLIDLGIDTYVRKEISVHPERANDFVGGIVLVRMLLSVLVFIGMGIVLSATHVRRELQYLVLIYGFTQFFTIGNSTSAGLLQAVGRVNEMSVLSVVTKLLWGLCLVVAILSRMGLFAFALTYMLTEAFKSAFLFRLARRHVGFGIHFRFSATRAAMLAALPFFVSSLASKVYDKIGASLLAFMTSDREVGWYGAAGSLVGLTMLLAPLVGWVVIPLFARAAAKSKDDFYNLVRRSTEYLLSLSIPVSLAIALGAEIWIRIIFGQAYAPAVLALQIFSFATVLMYVSIIAFNALAVLNYNWHVSLIAVGGMFVSPLTNWLLIPWMSTRLGPGGGAAGSSLATCVTEIGIVVPLLCILGRRGYDRKLIVTTAKNVTIAIVVSLMHAWLPRHWGLMRLVTDGVVYIGLAIATGGIDVRQLIRLFKMRSELRSSES